LHASLNFVWIFVLQNLRTKSKSGFLERIQVLKNLLLVPGD